MCGAFDIKHLGNVENGTKDKSFLWEWESEWIFKKGSFLSLVLYVKLVEMVLRIILRFLLIFLKIKKDQHIFMTSNKYATYALYVGSFFLMYLFLLS